MLYVSLSAKYKRKTKFNEPDAVMSRDANKAWTELRSQLKCLPQEPSRSQANILLA